MCQEGVQEEQIGHGPWYRRGEEPWLGIVTGVMARFLRRAPEALAAAEVSGATGLSIGLVVWHVWTD
jgi:hypothetical protein